MIFSAASPVPALCWGASRETRISIDLAVFHSANHDYLQIASKIIQVFVAFAFQVRHRLILCRSRLAGALGRTRQNQVTCQRGS